MPRYPGTESWHGSFRMPAMCREPLCHKWNLVNNSPPSYFFKRPSSFSYTLGKLTTATDLINHNTTYNPGNIITSADGTTYDHDNNGNLIAKVTGGVTTNYTYDTLNRLTGVNDGVTTYEYVYIGLGHRIAKIVNEVRTNFLVDPNGILAQVLWPIFGTYMKLCFSSICIYDLQELCLAKHA